MPTYFRPYHPDQDLLLPASLKEWLPENHLVYFIDDIVEALDLQKFYQRYRGDGRRKAPYEPRMMLKVLIYAYATGVFSSRKIARKLEEDVAFRILGAGNFPAHRSLRRFRQDHLEDFKTLFVQVVQIAHQAGLVSLGVIAVDGTKIKANASKHKAMSYGRMAPEKERLDKEIEELCQQAGITDQQEDECYGKASGGDELPEELAHRQNRRQKIKQAQQRLEQAQRKADLVKGRHPDDQCKPPQGGRPYKRDFGVPDDKAQSNFTDPDSKIMKSGNHFEQCFNGQLGVDRDFQIIVDNKLTANGSDVNELLDVVTGVTDNVGAPPNRVLADAGYRSEENLKALAEKEIDACINLGRSGKDAEQIDPKKYPQTRAMAEKLAGAKGKAEYAERKWIVEAANGWIKQVLGFRQFSVRGLNSASGEWDLVCLALNLRRMNPLMVFE